MDTNQTGLFLFELRKEKGLKQKQVAEILKVSDKAVSRWETGRGIPDVDSLQGLSDFYEVSINEILTGRRIEKDEIKKLTDENIKKIVKKTFNLKKKLAFAMIGIVGVVILLGIVLFMRIRPMLGQSYKITDGNSSQVMNAIFQEAANLEEAGINYKVILNTKDKSLELQIKD